MSTRPRVHARNVHAMTADACPTCGHRPTRRTTNPATRGPAANTAFTPSQCRRCNRPTLTGRTDALDRTLDATPLTPAGEYAATAGGRHTYDLNHATATARHRAHKAIGRPAADNHTVHTTHDCNQPIPLALSAAPVDRHKSAPELPINPPY